MVYSAVSERWHHTLCLCRYSGLPYDVTNEEALSHEPVQKLMEESIQQLRHWSDKFLELILSSLDQIPYGMRCIAKCMYDSLTEKFPTSPEKDVLKVMYTYLLDSEVWEIWIATQSSTEPCLN